MDTNVTKYAKLVLLFINFLKELEEVLDPEEKTLIDDKVLGVLEMLCTTFVK